MNTNLLRLLCKAEICNFGDSVTHEDVGQLEISMEELIFSDFEKAIDNVSHDGQNFSLAHAAFLLEEGAEIALIAELSDDIAMRSLADDIEALEDIGVLQLGQCLNFAVQHLSTHCIPHSLHIDGLYCHCLV